VLDPSFLSFAHPHFVHLPEKDFGTAVDTFHGCARSLVRMWNLARGQNAMPPNDILSPVYRCGSPSSLSFR
jgi:hypothetical protein